LLKGLKHSTARALTNGINLTGVIPFLWGFHAEILEFPEKIPVFLVAGDFEIWKPPVVCKVSWKYL
jgi:hypothetical protein